MEFYQPTYIVIAVAMVQKFKHICLGPGSLRVSFYLAEGKTATKPDKQIVVYFGVWIAIHS